MPKELLPFTGFRLKPTHSFRFGDLTFWVQALGEKDEPPFLPLCPYTSEECDVSGGVRYRCTHGGVEVCLLATPSKNGWVLALESDPVHQHVTMVWHNQRRRIPGPKKTWDKAVDDWAWIVQQQCRIPLELKKDPAVEQQEEGSAPVMVSPERRTRRRKVQTS